MMRYPALMAKIEDFGFHNYAGYHATVPGVIAQSAYADRGFWVTEHVLGETLDLVMVDNLMNHIDAGATAALVFKAYDQQDTHHPPGEDLLKGMLAEDGGIYTPRKSFYIMSQVHRFIRPGALRIAADESLSARIHAFHHPASGQVTILGRNGGGSTLITASLTNLPPVSRFEMYYTDQSSNFVRLADVAVSSGAFAFTAPANSVFTLTATTTDPPPPPPPPPPPGGDTQPPTATLTSPTGGATVSGSVTIAADAQDNAGVAAVQFLLDGAPLGGEDSTSPYSMTWDTTQTSNGTHVLSARARDAAGNLGTSSGVSVTVSNAASGLVAAYNFDEAGGTALVDRSGRGHHGVISGATWAAGRSGGALRFDGVNDLVTIADAPALDLSSLTIMAWVNPSAIGGSWRTVVLKEGSGELAYALYANEGAGHPGTWVRQGATSYSTLGPTAVATNTWTHLAATYGGGTLRLYVNGALVSSRALSVTVNSTSQPLRIGGNMVWSEWFAGLIDDVRIYDRSLGAAEIQNAMGAPVN